MPQAEKLERCICAHGDTVLSDKARAALAELMPLDALNSQA